MGVSATLQQFKVAVVGNILVASPGIANLESFFVRKGTWTSSAPPFAASGKFLKVGYFVFARARAKQYGDTCSRSTGVVQPKAACQESPFDSRFRPPCGCHLACSVYVPPDSLLGLHSLNDEIWSMRFSVAPGKRKKEVVMFW